MTASYRNINTPNEFKGKYAVHRQWNSFDGDFLHALDDNHGTICTGVGGAMVFDIKADAVKAAIKAKKRVPRLMNGAALRYSTVVLV